MKTAVVLFNLGGPDRPESVRPFLFNLFNDRAIISTAQPFRWLLAQVISRRRAPVARQIYDHIGGQSPLLEMTRQQATALQEQLAGGDEYQVFVSMRYWHPMADETAKQVKDFAPDRVVLLPLYPQFSTTTTGSSLTDWYRAAKAAGLDVPSHAICCYPQDDGFTDAVAGVVRQSLTDVTGTASLRVLFSAHGLPKKIVDGGDPYPQHIELSVRKIVDKLAIEGLDWVICYQSRVGPLEWIGPSCEDEIARAADDGKSIVIVPIAFVSEHSETLVELDIEYRELAEKSGVSKYVRVSTVGNDAIFISGLKDLVIGALNGDDRGVTPAITPGNGKRVCADVCPACPLN